MHKKPALSLLTLICLIVGNMIGVGVYVGGFYSLSSLKDARLVLLVWFIGGIHAICGAVAYGAVASRLPVSGGEYTYLTRCVHPIVGFVAGWISIIAGFTAPIAASALLIGSYIGTYGVTVSSKWIASLAIVFAAVLHAAHLKVGTSFNNLVIAIKLICFAIFLSLGIPYVLRSPSTGLLVNATEGAAPSEMLLVRLTEHDTIVQMVVSLFYVSLAYTGFNASIYLAGEIDTADVRSKKQSLVSRSMLIACIVVMVIYMLLNWVFLYGLGPQEIMAAGEGYVAEVARNVGGDWLSQIIRLAIILSAATSVLAMMAIGPMVYAQMADDGRLPQFFRLDSGVPRVAIAVQALLSCIVVWSSDIFGIIKYLGLTLTACGALAVSSIWFSQAKLATDSPVRWYEHFATAAYIGGAMLFLLVAYRQDPTQFWLCLATFGTGALAFFAVPVLMGR